MIGITASFIDDTSIHAQLAGTGALEATLSDEDRVINGVISEHTSAPVYDGEYIVTPEVENDIYLYTNDKLMKNDVTVKKIPYYETSNVSGYTVYIG